MNCNIALFYNKMNWNWVHLLFDCSVGGIHWCTHTFISTYNVHVRVRSCISFWGGQFKVKNYNYSKTFLKTIYTNPSVFAKFQENLPFSSFQGPSQKKT